MANDSLGYRTGVRTLTKYKVAAATADIVEGDLLTESAGYVLASTGADTIIGMAAEGVASPAQNGEVSILVDTCTTTVYRYTMASAVLGDIGAHVDTLTARTLDRTEASSLQLRIVNVDVDNATADVCLVAGDY